MLASGSRKNTPLLLSLKHNPELIFCYARTRVLVRKFVERRAQLLALARYGPLFDLGYSKRNAAIGSRRAAFCAG